MIAFTKLDTMNPEINYIRDEWNKIFPSVAYKDKDGEAILNIYMLTFLNNLYIKVLDTYQKDNYFKLLGTILKLKYAVYNNPYFNRIQLREIRKSAEVCTELLLKDEYFLQRLAHIKNVQIQKISKAHEIYNELTKNSLAGKGVFSPFSYLHNREFYLKQWKVCIDSLKKVVDSRKLIEIPEFMECVKYIGYLQKTFPKDICDAMKESKDDILFADGSLYIYHTIEAIKMSKK